MIRYDIIIRILLVAGLYYLLKYFWPVTGQYVLFPITRLVTVLHEIGHAVAAVLTGGSVEAVQINMDGSGFTRTRGGWRPVILMGGYLGSAIFGNLLLHASVKSKIWQQVVLYSMAGLMLITGIVWFNSVFSSAFLIIYSVLFLWIARKGRFLTELLVILGILTTVYIIEDFSVGPRSDLQQYAEVFRIGSSTIWMYTWLTIVIAITMWNLTRIAVRPRKK